MGNEILHIQALLWGILLAAIVYPGRLILRGRGLSEVKPLRIIGYVAVAAALMFALESPGNFSPVEVIRGGAVKGSSVIKRENPAFRIRRYDGTKARIQFERLKTEFEKKDSFKVKHQGAEKTLSAELIEEMVIKWFDKWTIDLPSSDAIPLTPHFVGRIMNIRKQLEEKKVMRDRFGRLAHCRGRDGFQQVFTETAQPIEIPEEDVSDYRRTMDFMTQNVTVTNSAQFRKTISIDQVHEMVDEMMMKEKVEVYNQFEDKYEALDQAGLKKLLDYENRIQVNWEKKWFAVSDDLFTFMNLRLEQASSNDENPRPAPASMKEFTAPRGYDPLKLDEDGLFLVTPKMEQLEEASFSIRGLADADEEIDEIHFPDPELNMSPEDLEKSYEGNDLYARVKEELLMFFVPLMEDDSSYLTQRFLARGKYLQQYAELRTFLPWMQKTLKIADDLDFDEKMEDFSKKLDNPGTNQEVSSSDLERHLIDNGLKHPMLSCREASGETHLRTLLAINVCLNRKFQAVNCESDGNCENKFHWATPRVR